MQQSVQNGAQVRQEKAAGCYPWTHLTHNEEEEVAVETEFCRTAWENFKSKVWIDPLSLPQDLSREAILRRDGTVPSEWFHLPEVPPPPFILILRKILTTGCSRPNCGGDAEGRLTRVRGGGGRASRRWNGGGAGERGGEEEENSQRKKNTSLWKT